MESDKNLHSASIKTYRCCIWCLSSFSQEHTSHSFFSIKAGKDCLDQLLWLMLWREASALSLSAIAMTCWTGRAQQHSRKRVSYLEIILQKSLLGLKFLAGAFHPNPLREQGNGLSSSGKAWQVLRIFEKQLKFFFFNLHMTGAIKRIHLVTFYVGHKPTYSTSNILDIHLRNRPGSHL